MSILRRIKTNLTTVMAGRFLDYNQQDLNVALIVLALSDDNRVIRKDDIKNIANGGFGSVYEVRSEDFVVKVPILNNNSLKTFIQSVLMSRAKTVNEFTAATQAYRLGITVQHSVIIVGPFGFIKMPRLANTFNSYVANVRYHNLEAMPPRITNPPRIFQDTQRRLWCDACNKLQKLNQNFFHCDLKLDNLMFDNGLQNSYIIDFGAASMPAILQFDKVKYLRQRIEFSGLVLLLTKHAPDVNLYLRHQDRAGLLFSFLAFQHGLRLLGNEIMTLPCKEVDKLAQLVRVYGAKVIEPILARNYPHVTTLFVDKEQNQVEDPDVWTAYGFEKFGPAGELIDALRELEPFDTISYLREVIGLPEEMALWLLGQ